MTTAVAERFEVTKVSYVDVMARTVEAMVEVLDLAPTDERHHGIYLARVAYDHGDEDVYRVEAHAPLPEERDAVEAWARASAQLKREMSERFESYWARWDADNL